MNGATRFLTYILGAVTATSQAAAAADPPAPAPAPAAATLVATPAPSAAPALGPLTGPQLGAPAPAFALKALDGRSVGLESFRGRTLVLNVWATWCPPCREEMPALIAAAPKLARAGVALVGVDTTEQAPIVRAYVVAKSVPYLQTLDADKTFTTAYDVQYFPTTYVIDPEGILRGRYIDVIAPVQLAALVDAAKQGKNAEIVSPLQQKIDAVLVDPAIRFSNDPGSVEANAKKADAAIANAEKLLGDSDSGKGNATDLLRTRAEEAALRDKAIAALVDVGTSVDDKALLPRLRGDAARDREQWKDALDAYRAVLLLDPKNNDALSGTAFAANRLEQYDVAVNAYRALAETEPAGVGDLVDLARAQAKAGQPGDAAATFERAIALGKQHVEASRGKAFDIRMLAYAHMYAGRTYAQAGDGPRARAEFDQLVAWAQKLPLHDARHDMYLEEGQEALVALGLAAPQKGASVSLAPWTGADLPGSIPNTRKYRLALTGIAGRSVALTAADVPKGWIASFCSDRVCAPFKVTVAIPESGVKIIEFQLVAPSARASSPRVRVMVNDGQFQSTATTT